MTNTADRGLQPSRLRFIGRAAAAAVVVLLCVVTLFAQPLGVSGWAVVAQMASFKVLAGLASATLAVLVAVVALVRGRFRSPTVLIICAALLAAGAIHVGTVLARGGTIAPVADPDITVVEFNTLDTATTAEQLANLVQATDADIMTLPEADEQTTKAAAELLAGGGVMFQVFSMSTPEPYPLPVSAMINSSLGNYRQVPGPLLRYGSLKLEPVTESTSAPTIIAVHPIEPKLKSTLTGWRSETTTAARLCTPGSNTIVAGDFNATVDHPAFADLPCADAATQAGAGGSGTWPAWLPSALAAPIDHVIIDPRSYRAVAAWTIRASTSDHRALVVQLRRA